MALPVLPLASVHVCDLQWMRMQAVQRIPSSVQCSNGKLVGVVILLLS